MAKDELITVKFETFGELLEFASKMPKHYKQQYYVKLTKGTYINTLKRIQKQKGKTE